MYKVPVLSVLFLSVGAGAATSAPVEWSVASGGNGHFYEIVIASVDWNTAFNAAAASTFNGVSGYLATITSAAELAFLDALYTPRTVSTLFDPPVDFSTLWLGGSDEAVEGVWRWVAGPETGQLISDSFENWGPFEPNDFGGIEDFLAGWYRTDDGSLWNDLPASVGAEAVGYIVEYGPAPSVVPVPAALPLLLAGLGGLAFLGRRRKVP